MNTLLKFARYSSFSLLGSLCTCSPADNIVIPEGAQGLSNKTEVVKTDNLLFSSSFEADSSLLNLYLERANDSSIISDSPSRLGFHSAKFTLNKTDADVSGSKRAEITPLVPDSNKKAQRWYGLSVFLPRSYAIDPCEESVFQWHGVGSVPIAMLTSNGHWKLVLKNSSGIASVDLGEYELEKWTDWVVYVQFSSESDGVLQIWKDGVPSYHRLGPNVYDEPTGNFFKFGIYKWGWTENEVSTTTERVLYIDEVKIANENGSFNEVSPGVQYHLTQPSY